jgi:hypothetical protein
MSFAAFLSTISSPSLKAVAHHWHDVRAGRRMPSWSDLCPSRIAAQLPIVWSYKYDAPTDSFIGRLAGDRISQIFGKNFRGLPLSELHSPEAFPDVFARCKRIVMEPALYHANGRVFRHLDRAGQGERIMLPLSSDDVLGDGILGATEYNYARSGLGLEGSTADGDAWYALGPR